MSAVPANASRNTLLYLDFAKAFFPGPFRRQVGKLVLIVVKLLISIAALFLPRQMATPMVRNAGGVRQHYFLLWMNDAHLIPRKRYRLLFAAARIPDSIRMRWRYWTTSRMAGGLHREQPFTCNQGAHWKR